MTNIIPRRLILASQSPRRLDLLASIGVKPDHIHAPNIDETPLKGEIPRLLALRLAQAKAISAEKELSNQGAYRLGDIIVSADNVVAVGLRILDKPKTIEEARCHLSLLSGRRHHVYGAIAMIGSNGKLRLKLSHSQVIFKQLSPTEIKEYLASQEWQDKAGGYAIQGLAAKYIKSIQGSYSNIVGLDLALFYNLFQSS